MYYQNGTRATVGHDADAWDACKFADEATCAKAVDMLNRADFLNNVKRKYSASARLHAQVCELPGYVDLSMMDSDTNQTELF